MVSSACVLTGKRGAYAVLYAMILSLCARVGRFACPCKAIKAPGSVMQEVRSKKGSFGYNARTAEYGDMIQMGVVDPTKVVRTALENASSIAALLLTTEAMVTDEPEEEPAPAAPAGHHHPH